MNPEAFSLAPTVSIRGSAEFARSRTIRRTLRRWWVTKPTKWVAWLMLNPSDAAELRNDPTLLTIIEFSRSWECYDGLVVVNLYPFIASDPRRMWRWADWQNNGPDWYARDDMQANRADIESIGRSASTRIVAFGAQAMKDQDWMYECIEAFAQPGDETGDTRLYCLGTTKSGMPIHPLARGRHRIPRDRHPEIWRQP